jgi:exopolysaccharide biosynthesis polyprenyl glycosylphosphotransferase
MPFLQCNIQADLQLPRHEESIHGAPVLSVAELQHPERLSVDEVMVTMPQHLYEQVSPVVDILRGIGKPISSISDGGVQLSLRDRLLHVGRVRFMGLAISPVESFAYTVGKRTFDLLFAVVGLIVMSPLIAVIAFAVKLSSPGPILFWQERVGRHGKRFRLVKFRTMYCSDPAESDTIWTLKGDPRCTPLGTILRKSSLDELPQIWNVIRGEMSLVGPRPERPYFVAKFTNDIENYNVRHRCQVGMTGWAQVNGLRGDTSISQRLEYDLRYLSNWTFAWDIAIIVRTIAILRKQTGY